MTLTAQEEEFVRRLRHFAILYRADIEHVVRSLAHYEPEAKA